MKTLLFLVFLLFTLFSSAQHPAYYIFAKEQFKGVDIYDVIQDDKLNYWFATDHGIFVHDGYSYEKTSCPEMKGSSVFGFVKDSEGTIYCYNLHQQIFRIQNGKMELYFQIPEDMVHHELNLLIDKKDRLLIQSTGIIRISPNKASIEIIRKELFNNASPLSFFMLPDGSTISTTMLLGMAHQKDGKITKYSHQMGNESTHYLNGPFTWVTLKNRVYAIEREDLEVFELNTEKFTFTYVATLNQKLANQSLRVHTTENQLWVTGIANGTFVYDTDFNPMYNGESIYPSNFISDFFTDAEGNLLLSTFDDGVIVIPNTNILGYTLPNEEKITRITSNKHASLFIGTDLGNIYHFWKGTIKLIHSDPLQKSNEGIEYWEELELLVFYTAQGAQFSHWDGDKLTFIGKTNGAFKNAHFSDNSNGLLALNTGVSRVFASNQRSLEFQMIEQLKKRAYCVVQDQKTQTIYAGMSSGLVRLNKSGILEPVKYAGKIIYPNSLIHRDGLTYIGTRKFGILVYENDQLKRRIPFNDPIRKMILHEDQLFILSNNGLHVADLDGSRIKQLNNSAGVSFDFISDFHITNNSLYISDSESLQYISLDKLFIEPAVVPIRFKQILVNGQIAETNHFQHDQRKIEMNFEVSTLRFRDNINYRFKLKGYEDDWQTASYIDNKVTYNALSPGEYTFMVQCLNGSTKSEVIEYSFTIDAPFHQKWWFYVLITIASGMLMAIIFIYRIRKIRKKNEARLEKQKIQTEIVEFELKALRSQMNPHFIFNSLNSIQDLILKEETDASYDYIVLFADLVRNTLHYTNKDFIEIEKELEFIKVYLSLEKLRFKEEFEYTIESNDLADIKLPSLIIQPFIENALVHGLIHKEGLKLLSIKFEMNGDQLTCVIRDNGIGRVRAKEIQKRQGNHESFALSAIAKRLSILNKQNEYECGFEINDLEENGQAIGTEVILTLPYKHAY